jgi:hypothetical protein
MTFYATLKLTCFPSSALALKNPNVYRFEMLNYKKEVLLFYTNFNEFEITRVGNNVNKAPIRILLHLLHLFYQVLLHQLN